MSKKLGDIEYNELEYLNLGADYKEPDEKCNIAGIAELNIIVYRINGDINIYILINLRSNVNFYKILNIKK